MKKTMQINLKNYAMSDQLKQDNIAANSANELLSVFLDYASEAKAELIEKELATFLVLEGVMKGLLEDPEVSKRGLFERHSDGTEYFLWDAKKVLKFNPPPIDENMLTFDCERLYLK